MLSTGKLSAAQKRGRFPEHPFRNRDKITEVVIYKSYGMKID
jgi:hypothetical protein